MITNHWLVAKTQIKLGLSKNYLKNKYRDINEKENLIYT